MRIMSWMRPGSGPGPGPGSGLNWSHSLFYLTLLLWTRRLNGLADFSNYLSRIITSHSAHACDGQPVRLHCPRHSTISIQSAFYGSGGGGGGEEEEERCSSDHDSSVRGRNHSCSAFTALQKLLSECQSHRDCQLPVNHLLFGKDPCPGTTKYLHVDYKCKPTEHKRQLSCEGETLVLRCKPPRVLNIYAAVYGRRLDDGDICSSRGTRPPLFECLNHEAVHLVSKSCYSKQKCVVAVNNQTFRDPCFPGTRKYLSVVYSCVPRSLLKEADPDVFISTSSPTVDTDEAAETPFSTGSRNPDGSGAMMSDSLLTYAFIKEHPEMAALLFTSSVCIGLVLTLLAVSVRVTCRRRQVTDPNLTPKHRHQTVTSQEDDDDVDDGDDDDEGTESSLVSSVDRTAMSCWEEVTYVSEAAERAERIERREMIIQEIWMNAYLNGSSC